MKKIKSNDIKKEKKNSIKDKMDKIIKIINFTASVIMQYQNLS